MTACLHMLGPLACVNAEPHEGSGRGCVHISTSGVPDAHTVSSHE